MIAKAASSKVVSDVRRRVTQGEWNARVDLAAAYRICAAYGWNNFIYNHVTMRVPGEPKHFLLKPNDLMFEEVTASTLIKLDLDGNPVDEDDNVNAAGYTIHTAVLIARQEINCVLHVHTPVGMAISAYKNGLLPINQGAMRFYNRIAYHDYEGFSTDLEDREKIAKDLGKHKAMIMRNHGLLTLSETVQDAVMWMKYLVESCETQLQLGAMSTELIIPSHELCEGSGCVKRSEYA